MERAEAPDGLVKTGKKTNVANDNGYAEPLAAAA